MAEREVKEVVTPVVASDGAGVRLKRSIATRTLDHLDPFFLFDHFGSENADDYIAGFPMHPHRGIETITYMLDGSVSHKDSMGNSGVIGAGDVQWMTAGSGILHEEMPRVGPRRLDGFQVWVNLPRKLKMTAPRYQDVAAARIPEVARPGGARVRVIAGDVDGTAGAVREIFAGPTYLDVALPAGASFEQPVSRGHTALLYVFQGEVAVDGQAFRCGGRDPCPAPRHPRGRRRGPRSRPGRAGPLPAPLGAAPRGARGPLGPLRHEHPGRDRPGASGVAGRDVHQEVR